MNHRRSRGGAGAEPGQSLSRELATGDRADLQIDAFISKHHEKRRKDEPDRETEAVWREAERREVARRRRENRAGWYGWHMDRAGLYARLSEEHAGRAEKLMEETNERKTA